MTPIASQEMLARRSAKVLLASGLKRFLESIAPGGGGGGV